MQDRVRKIRKSSVRKIVSGGQTGADRAALDFAIENNFDYGGFVPKGRVLTVRVFLLFSTFFSV
jgi:hypothetical protein